MNDLRMPEITPAELSERRIVLVSADGVVGIVGLLDGPAASHVPAMQGRPAFKLTKTTTRAVYYAEDTDPVEAPAMIPFVDMP